MYEVFADLHVHIGRTESGKPVKITAARSLNFANIAKECAERKGINIVGIIDCASPYVIEDIENFLKTGEAYELEDGGIIYKDKVCILLGSEVETSEVGRNGKCGAAHNVCFFPHLKDIKAFSNEMSNHIKNITLSTQRSDISGYELIDIVEKYNGILIPAHIFTPFKSYYGNCNDRIKNIFKEKYDKIFAVELGLSSDTFLADEISELENKTFVTNSDAHSLPKIAREYNKMQVEDISFKEVVKALKNEEGRKIISNYGLDPKLGKYHRTFCDDCNNVIETKEPISICPNCGSDKVTFGVFDRIELIKDKKETKSPEHRPPYIYQVPLGFIPGVGGKTIEKLLDTFETEMNILHKLSQDDIEAVVGSKVATAIEKARTGNAKVQSGGGGNYRKDNIRKNLGGINMKNTKGITLVALVITIIILLILAGITISQLSGNGLFENAKLAKEKTENAQAEEDGILGDYENKIGQYIDGIRNGNVNYENCTIETSKKGHITLQKEEGINIIGFAVIQDNKCIKMVNGYTCTELYVAPGNTVDVYIIAMDENTNVYKSNTVKYTPTVEYLYYKGNECIDITGGWKIYHAGGSSTETTGDVTSSLGIKWAKNENNMYLWGQSIHGNSSAGYIEYQTQNKINTVGSSSIEINCDVTGGSDYCVAFVKLLNAQVFSKSGSNVVASTEDFAVSTENSKIVTLDTTNYQGEYYVSVYIGHGYSGQQACELTINKIQLNP